MDIGSSNASLTLAIFPLFAIPQVLQGFATDDVYDIPRIKSVDTQMGVDGVLSAGFTYVEIPQTIYLQADSASNLVFDTWWAQMQAAQTTYRAQGLIRLPSIGSKFVQRNGFLTGYKPSPQVKKLLQRREYEITWEAIFPLPA